MHSSKIVLSDFRPAGRPAVRDSLTDPLGIEIENFLEMITSKPDFSISFLFVSYIEIRREAVDAVDIEVCSIASVNSDYQ